VEIQRLLQERELVARRIDDVDPDAPIARVTALLEGRGVERCLLLERPVVIDAARDHVGRSVPPGPPS